MSETQEQISTPETKENRTPTREMFTKEYVTELREEAKAYRLKNSEWEKKYNELQTNVEKSKSEYEKSVSDLTNAAKDKLIRAEVKSHAIKAGVVDLRALKIVDYGTFKLNEETGEIENADEVFKTLKKDMPFLFGQPSTSSAAPQPKAVTQNQTEDAMQMSDKEWREKLRRIHEGL